VAGFVASKAATVASERITVAAPPAAAAVPRTIAGVAKAAPEIPTVLGTKTSVSGSPFANGLVTLFGLPARTETVMFR